MDLRVAIEQRNWLNVRRILQEKNNGEVQRLVNGMQIMDLSSCEYCVPRERVTILHLLCLFVAPSDIIRHVLQVRPKLATYGSMLGREWALHYMVGAAATAAAVNHPSFAWTWDVQRSIQVLVDACPASVVHRSSGLSRFADGGSTPLHIAVSHGAPPSILSLLLGKPLPYHCAKEIQNDSGQTPYDLLLSQGNLGRYEATERSKVLNMIRPFHMSLALELPVLMAATCILIVTGSQKSARSSTGFVYACGVMAGVYGAKSFLKYWLESDRQEPTSRGGRVQYRKDRTY